MNFMKKNGITLIALVVTIIVLLILAGVSISMLTGQNGILNRAAEAKKKTEESGEKEKTDSGTLHRTDEIGNTYRLRAGANTGKNHTVFGEKPVRRLSHAENGE